MRLQTEEDDDVGTDGADQEGTAAETRATKGFSFDDMRLGVGDRLQVECPVATGGHRSFVRVVGYMQDTSLIVTTPTAGGKRIGLVEGDLLVVRVFSRQSAFAFRAHVLRVCRLPFEYLHLSFPTLIQGSIIRKATRVRTQLPADTGPEAAGAETVPGVLLNMSATGVLLHTKTALGDKGAAVVLRFTLKLHDVDNELTVVAEIRNVEQAIDADGIEYYYGLDFRDNVPRTRMLIRSFVYQTIIEQPRHVI